MEKVYLKCGKMQSTFLVALRSGRDYLQSFHRWVGNKLRIQHPALGMGLFECTSGTALSCRDIEAPEMNE
jgi:hypothetical protein